MQQEYNMPKAAESYHVKREIDKQRKRESDKDTREAMRMSATDYLREN